MHFKSLMHSFGTFIACAFTVSSSLFATDGYQVIPDTNPLQVLTPELAKRTVAKIQLDNGMQVLLISDPETDISGAGIAVNAGSWSDPKTGLGMAHFTEHMLFLGTTKYPNEEEYQGFLAAHGGKANAFTAPDRTVYIFTVRNDAFLEALDRFAQFFISPLFNTSSVERETIAIDQENAKNIQSDLWRLYFVQKATGNPDHPQNQFATGNRETISQISPEALKQWYLNHYSANLMHLVVCSKLPMDQLIAAVVNDFKAVPNRKFTPFAPSLPIFDTKMEGKVTWALPYQEVRELTLTWELPAEWRDQGAFVGQLLQSGRTGSLQALLQKEGLAEGVSVGIDMMYPSMLFSLDIDLTDKGVKEWEKVTDYCFEEIALLNKGIPYALWEEQRDLATLDYEYQSRADAFDWTMNITASLIDESLTSYPYDLLIPKWNENQLKTFLKALTPQTCHYFVMAETTPPQDATLLKEKWIGVEYFIEPINEKTMKEWTEATANHALQLPPANPFIAHNLSLLNPVKNPQFSVPTPKLLIDMPSTKLWFAPDLFFQVPKAAGALRIYAEELDALDGKKAALLDLYTMALNYVLQDTTSAAAQAGLSWSVGTVTRGISLDFSGYSSTLPLLFDKVSKQLTVLPLQKDEFKILKESLRTQYQNSSSDTPLKQGIELFTTIFSRYNIPNDERLSALGELTLDDFNNFTKELFARTAIEAVFYGNLDEKQTQEMVLSLDKALNSRAWPLNKIAEQEILQLPSTGPIYSYVKKVQQPGQLAFLVIQNGCFSYENEAALIVLNDAIRTPFFDELRTKQQTGYIVLSTSQGYCQQLMEWFLVQSSTHPACDLLARFELFFENFLRSYRTSELTEKTFNAIRAAKLDTLRQPAKSLEDMTRLLAGMAFECNSDFKRLERQQEALTKLSYEELCSYVDGFLSRHNKRRLGMLIEGVQDPLEQVCYTDTDSRQQIWKTGTFHTAEENMCAPKAAEQKKEAA